MSDWLDEWQANELALAEKSPTYGLSVPRQNGKTAVAEEYEVKALNVGRRVLHTAHEVKTARKAFLRLVGWVEHDQRVKNIRYTNGQEAVFFDNGGSVEFIARSKSSGRGFTAEDLVCDEAQELTDDQLAALLPTISAGLDPHLLMFGTPPRGTGLAGAPFRRIRAEAATDPEIHFSDYGLPDGPLPDDLRSMERARMHNPAMGAGRLAEREVRREAKVMDDRDYARERLGWWGDPAEALIPSVLPNWNACVMSMPHEPLALGVAINPDREWVSLVAASALHIDPVMRVPVAESWRVVAYASQWQTDTGGYIMADPNGPAGTLIDTLEESGCYVASGTSRQYAHGCSYLYDNHLTGALTCEPYNEMNTTVLNASWRMVGDMRVFDREGDQTMIEAAVWALVGARQAGEL